MPSPSPSVVPLEGLLPHGHGHQPLQSLDRRLLALQYVRHPEEDGILQVQPVSLALVQDHGLEGDGGVDPLGHLGRRRQDLIHGLPLPQPVPELAVARQGAEACAEGVPDAGEAGDGAGPRPQRVAQAPHLPAAPGHQARHGVRAQAQALAHAGGDRDDVLDGAPDLHPDDVRGGEDAEDLRGEQVGQVVRELLVLGRDDDGRDDSLANLPGEGGAAEKGERPLLPQALPKYVGHEAVAGRLDPFGGRQDRHPGGNVLLYRVQEFAAVLAGDGVDHVGGVAQGGLRVGRRPDGFRQVEVGHVARVAVIRVDLFGDVLRPDEEGDGDALPSEGGGEGEAEIPTPQHGDAHRVRRQTTG